VGKTSSEQLNQSHPRLATRRRKHCGHCGYRVTTHEVSVEFYNRAKENQMIVDKFRKLLGSEEPQQQEEQEPKCSDCKYNKGSKCSFDFPEYDTPDSFDCNHYDN
jgi:hypothetical protein